MEQDWTKAQEMLESGEIWRGEVTEYNRGGVLVKFGHLRAFVPASHLSALNRRHLSPDQRTAQLQECIGRELSLKVIEVDRHRRRLVLSERLARRHMRKWAKERLLNELVEGQVCRGTVCQLCDFGAFVDLKGADGLIHISELAWRRIRHPSEVLQVGDEIDVYVLRLDHERKRIGLSLKRLQPNPWDLVDTEYTKGQLLMGKVTNVVDFGAFVALDIGVQGLVHVSELADPPLDPRSIVQPGETLVLRVLHINPRRHRIALSLKRVSAQERDEWLAQQSRAHSIEIDGAGEEEEKTPPTLAHAAGALRSGLPGPMADRKAPAELAPALVESSEDEMYWISLAQDAPTKKES
ncbi:MAG: S1 RNA-binding domain-containing protein [Chloroflexota bacterium]|nr:S1 RNA-binding domain-containing protein [Chloroflexota bacterium]